RKGPRLRRLVSDLLNRPIFGPPKKDGSPRRYRYPNRKADLVQRADSWLRTRSASTSLAQLLVSQPTEKSRREVLCQCPGVGPKTASWVLRNVGLAQNLAVLDVHVLRAMAEAGRLSEPKTLGDYQAVEENFLDWCREYDASPAAFDLLLWEWQ